MTRSQNVIVSAAKQSIAQQESKQEWIASSQELLAMTVRDGSNVETWVRDLAARLARGLPSTSRTRKQRARGNAGCTVHQRSRVQSYQGKRTRAYRSTEITRHPRTQWLYGLCRALPGARARFVTVTGGISSTGLLPACGSRTTRIFRTRRMLNVKKHLPRPPQPAPRL